MGVVGIVVGMLLKHDGHVVWKLAETYAIIGVYHKMYEI